MPSKTGGDGVTSPQSAEAPAETAGPSVEAGTAVGEQLQERDPFASGGAVVQGPSVLEQEAEIAQLAATGGTTAACGSCGGAGRGAVAALCHLARKQYLRRVSESALSSHTCWRH